MTSVPSPVAVRQEGAPPTGISAPGAGPPLDYAAFLAGKRLTVDASGVTVSPSDLSPHLSDFQRDVTRLALAKGRYALFEDTGLGKTFQQLEWARLAADRSLILAPLAVSQQTVREAAKWGIPGVVYAASEADAPRSGIVVTNYERLHLFDPGKYGAVVLDESSILKNYSGKTRTALIEAFAATPMRLCCTATPAPNDIAEIANHAEFLGVMTREGMLATFFVHDDEGWRLKRPARAEFWRWLASWGMFLRHPRDLGYEADGYDLPPLDVTIRRVEGDFCPPGQLVPVNLGGIVGRGAVRREAIDARLGVLIEMMADADGPVLILVDRNDESTAVVNALPGAVEVKGTDDADVKAARLLAFADGEIPVMVSKPSIVGYGLNLQVCAHEIFFGLSDSYERYYQTVRRIWRFGQTRRCRVDILLTDIEAEVWSNVSRKEQTAMELANGVIGNVAEFCKGELAPTMNQTDEYTTATVTGNGWTMMLGDSAERLAEIETGSVGLSVFSPPFLSLFQYSNSPRDLGNCQSPAEFWQHFAWLSPHLLRVMMPGRLVCVHVANTATTLAHHGYIGIEDFRGMTIRHFVAAGFVHHGEVCIDKNPQSQAIRTHAKGLLFAQKNKDSTWSRPALADYILVFRAPGVNPVPVVPDVTNEEWIKWAHPTWFDIMPDLDKLDLPEGVLSLNEMPIGWYGIRESDTLNTAAGKGQDDERHICPLQLGTIERCVRLWSNAGELVLSPFGGIGSEGHEAVRLGRKYVGIELKRSYFDAACRNLAAAERQTLGDLFAWADMAEAEAVPA